METTNVNSPNTLQPLQFREYEVKSTTLHLLDGDILDSEQFPELPGLLTPHVYRFIRDGRKASDDRLRALGGAAFCYLNLLPNRGHAIVVPSRWTQEMFCSHFGISRHPPTSTEPLLTPTRPVQILRRPGGVNITPTTSAPEILRPRVTTSHPTVQAETTPTPSTEGEQKPKVHFSDGQGTEAQGEEAPGPTGYQKDDRDLS